MVTGDLVSTSAAVGVPSRYGWLVTVGPIAESLSLAVGDIPNNIVMACTRAWSNTSLTTGEEVSPETRSGLKISHSDVLLLAVVSVAFSLSLHLAW